MVGGALGLLAGQLGVERERIDVILPMTDVTTHAVARDQKVLGQHTALAVPFGMARVELADLIAPKVIRVESLKADAPPTQCVLAQMTSTGLQAVSIAQMQAFVTGAFSVARQGPESSSAARRIARIRSLVSMMLGPTGIRPSVIRATPGCR